MNQHEIDRLNFLIRLRTKRGADALSSSEQDELIRLLLQLCAQPGGSAAVPTVAFVVHN